MLEVMTTRLPHFLTGVLSHLSQTDATSLRLGNHAFAANIDAIAFYPNPPQEHYHPQGINRWANAHCEELCRGGHNAAPQDFGPCTASPGGTRGQVNLRVCGGLPPPFVPLPANQHVPGRVQHVRVAAAGAVSERVGAM
ncbi:hypothetical protein MMC30_000722 [Trapelia coarctata]|nr:hypothetical protein [Trapelia coarctata]